MILTLFCDQVTVVLLLRLISFLSNVLAFLEREKYEIELCQNYKREELQ